MEPCPNDRSHRICEEKMQLEAGDDFYYRGKVEKSEKVIKGEMTKEMTDLPDSGTKRKRRFYLLKKVNIRDIGAI